MSVINPGPTGDNLLEIGPDGKLLRPWKHEDDPPKPSTSIEPTSFSTVDASFKGGILLDPSTQQAAIPARSDDLQ